MAAPQLNVESFILQACTRPSCGLVKGLMRCSCHAAAYCGGECQRSDWARHKGECAAIRRAAVAAASAGTSPAPLSATAVTVDAAAALVPTAPSAAPAVVSAAPSPTPSAPAVPTAATVARAPAPAPADAPAASGTAVAGKPTSPAAASGYPTQPLINVHDDAGDAIASFAVVRGGAKRGGGHAIIFQLLAKDDRESNGSTIVSRSDFLKHFHIFTGGALSAMTPASWANVTVAGGSVLASILALEGCWRQMTPSPLSDETRDFVRRGRGSDPFAALEARSTTVERFFTEVRWPRADIDIFIHGLDAATADMKAVALLGLITKAYHSKGATNISYVRTPNTITIECGVKGVRKVQIITRLYDSPETLLNGFDVDSCCIGFDGSRVFCTERARAAIAQKVNTVNLDIRGASYENRLIKYASRGFAIAVPGLERSRIDLKNIEVKLSKRGSYGWEEFIGEGFSWSKWQDSGGTLLRILLVEQVAKSIGYLDEPFKGRIKHEPPSEVVSRFHFLTATDTYSSTSGRSGSFPATLKPSDLVGPNATRALRVVWQEGAMPRAPLSFESWAVGVYVDTERKSRHGHYDYEKMAAERARAEAAKKAAEESKQEAAREAIRMEAREALATQAALQKEVEAQLRVARAETASAQRQAAAAEAGAAAGGDSGECIVCCDVPRDYMIAPCGHLVTCEACALRLTECPVCRKAIKRSDSRKVYT